MPNGVAEWVDLHTTRSMMPDPIAIGAIQRLIYTSCLALDEEQFGNYLDLLAPDFQYVIKAYSTELRRDMIWLDLDRKGIEGLFASLPNHVRFQGSLLRHASVYTVDMNEDSAQAKALTSVTVIHTDLDGASRLMAAGRYHDAIDFGGKRPLLRERVVRLDTRVFDNESGGSHLPI
jgi:methanesulfonate monooxygenase subunit beta